jgi:precorrin-8X/cobalt-precorrin-8 methylmutase
MKTERSSAALFDTYVIVDWSAANTPKRGKDSIWIATSRRKKNGISLSAPKNPATRSEAMAIVTEIAKVEIVSGRRIFLGFDFPFGYPAGASKMLTGKVRWDALWKSFAKNIKDDDRNRSNRYEFANEANRRAFKAPVFWGRPHQHSYSHLGPRKVPCLLRDRMDFRHVEKLQPPAKSVWQLAYNGAVGSQAMLGMARLESFRDLLAGKAQIWPFETRFAESLEAPIVIAEIYPSMFDVSPHKDEVKDCAQVRTVAQYFARLDCEGAFRRLLSKPDALNGPAFNNVLREEGWIVGAGHERTS